MSGVIGHVMYAILGAKASASRRLPIMSVINHHYPSYLAGAYRGCDIQTMPSGINLKSGDPFGYGTLPSGVSELNGLPVKPWRFRFQYRDYTSKEVTDLFYGRSHLVLGWSADDLALSLPWDHLPDYIGSVVEDSFELFGPGRRQLAYVLGWAAHVAGDALIKDVRPGIELELLNGKYTPQNRPIQDLIAFHEIGRNELHLNWESLLADLCATPVEPIQPHYMRVTKRRGELGERYPVAWAPEKHELLLKLLETNRWYLKLWIDQILEKLVLRSTPSGLQCHPELSATANGLSYLEMIELAETANFRHALWQMGEEIADLFEAVVEITPRLQKLLESDLPSWTDITARWKTTK